jgi:putative transposase
MQDFPFDHQGVFHIFNRSNDRRPIFNDDENYQFFLSKLVRQMKDVAEILAYCLMPNHYHLLVIPMHDVLEELAFNADGTLKKFPTKELGEGTRRLQMGYTKSYNSHYGITGSRWQQHAKVTSHGETVSSGINYLHMNPVEGKLVDHPSEWGFSSFNEYSGIIHPSDCIANVTLGQQLLKLETL